MSYSNILINYIKIKIKSALNIFHTMRFSSGAFLTEAKFLLHWLLHSCKNESCSLIQLGFSRRGILFVPFCQSSKLWYIFEVWTTWIRSNFSLSSFSLSWNLNDFRPKIQIWAVKNSIDFFTIFLFLISVCSPSETIIRALKGLWSKYPT